MQVRLDIDLIPEDLYRLLLEEFRNQFGEGVYGVWEITAEKEEGGK